MRSSSFTLLIALFFMAAMPSLYAQEVLTIESTVTGSKEQPKVISIVPWQDADKPGYYGSDLTGLVELGGELEVEPLNRESFIQEVNYIRATRQSQ